jgi:cell division protein FtsQ
MSAEPEYLPADVLAEDEPKYLRRQKQVEIRKRKFSRTVWPLYRRVLVGTLVALAGGLFLYKAGVYFLYSPGVMLTSADQIEVTNNRYVPAAAIIEKFSDDMGRSVVRVPLEERRKMIESFPWVEQADVQRVLPNRVRVDITERTPVAFLRTANDLSLVDASGVILDRPMEGEFHFPVAGGLSENMPLATRQERMQLFVRFMKEIEQSQPGAGDHVSEVDLGDATDIRATLTGLGAAANSAEPVLVHFGDTDFANRYYLLTQNIDQWRSSSGQIESVDLRFSGQVVVNPEPATKSSGAAHRASVALKTQ